MLTYVLDHGIGRFRCSVHLVVDAYILLMGNPVKGNSLGGFHIALTHAGVIYLYIWSIFSNYKQYVFTSIMMWSLLFLMFVLISCSDSGTTENKVSTVGVSDGVSSSSKPSGFQSAWLGVPGQVSMADIVKMGRPQNKASAMPSHHSVNHLHSSATPLAPSPYDLHSSENHASQVSETEPEVVASQHVHSSDEWPSIEQPPAATVPSILEVPADSELHADPSNVSLDRVNEHINSQLDDDQSAEDGHVETLNGSHVGPASISSRNIQEDGSGGSSLFDNNLYGNMGSYQAHRHAFEHNEG